MPPVRKKRKVAANFSWMQHDISVWRNAKRRSAYNSFQPNDYSGILNGRKLYFKKKYRKFTRSFQVKRRGCGSKGTFVDTVKRLTHWIKYNSWTYCTKCGLLQKKDLHPSSFNQKGTHVVKEKNCVCSKNRYTVPKYKTIPRVLRALSEEDEKILRIFEIDVGPRKVAPMGHRMKNGAFELRIREDTVEQRIDNITCDEQKNRVENAYNYLSTSKTTSYGHYLKYQREYAPGTHIKFWVVYQKMVAVECALWPVLYPFSRWCESTLKGDQKESILHSFRIKLLSNITSYNNNFELLQLHYDKWIFKTVTGAVSSGKFRHCSPLKSLENKHFTAGYWRWQNRFLSDACLQYGPPKLFITITPYEWDFPMPIWIEDYQQQSGCIPTKTGAVETIHIAHILEQYLRGYITGVNSSQWERHEYHHLLYAKKHKLPGNVQCVFYRFEYQNRRTIHIHMLVWLKSFVEISTGPFKATVPQDNVDDAYLVHRLQQSDRSAAFLNVTDETTATSDELHLFHRTEDKEINLRAFIDTVLFSLQSRMDVQTSDGRQALMRYVTSYVSKLSENAEILRSLDSTTFQQAWPFLIDVFPGEPEMTMAFANMKISHCNVSRFKIVPPTFEFFDDNSIFNKYINRLPEDENQTCLQYCRSHCMSKAVPTRVFTSNLVGVHYKYIFNPRFLWEYVIMNTPFRDINTLKDLLFDDLPQNLKMFSFFFHNHRNHETSPEFVNFLECLGYNDRLIKEFQQVLQGYKLVYYKYRSISSSFVPSVCDVVEDLTVEQSRVFSNVVEKIKERLRSCQYSTLSQCSSESSDVSVHSTGSNSCLDDEYIENSESDSDKEVDSGINLSIAINSNLCVEDNIKGILIKGPPGTGKSAVIKYIVNHCISKGLKVLVASATAYHARAAKISFPHELVYTETIHSIFFIPIDGTQPTLNWGLVKFDVIIIDEVGMVSIRNIKHVVFSITSLPIPPVYLFSGDPYQQRPLDNVEGTTTQTTNIFVNTHFLINFDVYNFTHQHRFKDSYLESLLKIMRTSYISNDQLRVINSRCDYQDEVCSENIVNAFLKNPDTLFVTLTRKGSRFVNSVITEYIFSSEPPLSVVRDGDLCDITLYENLRICITENVNKHHGIVNGAEAIVIAFDRHFIIIKLLDNSIHFLYPMYDELNDICYYPFLVNYCLTIFKCQGKNLSDVTIWLDRKRPSPGAAYVAFSRVQHFRNIHLLERVNRFQICPIKMLKVDNFDIPVFSQW